MPAFVDRRAGSAQYLDLLLERGIPTLHHHLDYGDVMIPGNGPKGKVKVGVEIKTVADFRDSFDAKRLMSQLAGMIPLYDHTLLLVTGAGELHRGHSFTFLFQAGVLLHREPSEFEGAEWLASLYRWWQKPWAKHSSLKGLELPRQGKDESLIPVDPSPTRMQAAILPGIGWELSGRIAKQFTSPWSMMRAFASVPAPKVPGIGPKRVEAIQRWMRGR